MSLNRQASHQKQMAAHVKYCKELKDDTSESAILLKMDLIKALYEEFAANQRELEEVREKAQFEIMMQARARFEDSYFFCCVKIQDLMKAKRDLEDRDRQARGENNRRAQQQEVKLPRIELTPFSGKYEDWATFHDLFNSLIHTNGSIADVQKLHYLKANVLGDAESLLRSITITKANYAEAWTKLKNRYNHKRFIVDSLLRKFFALPRVTRENHVEIKYLVDQSSEIIQSLRLQGIPVGNWDVIVVHDIVSKLDTETHKQWELNQKKDEIAPFNELESFLQARWQSLEMIQGGRTSNQSTYSSSNVSSSINHSGKSFQSQELWQRSGISCFECNESGHKLYSCPKYNDFRVNERKNQLRNGRLCCNCLAQGHSSSDCRSQSRCKHCKGKHHTSIHDNTSDDNFSSTSSSQNVAEKKTTAASSLKQGKNEILLATAVVCVHALNGERIIAKALVDLASRNTIVTTALARKLGLIGHANLERIAGIGDVEVPTREEMLTLTLLSYLDPTFTMDLSTSVMDKITGDLPSLPVQRKEWPHLKGIKLADPHFDRPSPVELLLGAEVYEEILLDRIIRKNDFSSTAQNSRLGWLLFKTVKRTLQSNQTSLKKVSLLTALSSDYALNQTLKAFWGLEEIPEERTLTIKEREAENIYLESVHQNEEGRNVVSLPFDSDKKSKKIGESRKAALHGLFRLEARFKSNERLRNGYKNYIQALIEADHCELVPRNRLNLGEREKYYLPHHAVLKEESLTTKLRVVFDASRKSATGISLNDKLLVGPKTQEDLFCILVRWRKHKFTLLADVGKCIDKSR